MQNAIRTLLDGGDGIESIDAFEDGIALVDTFVNYGVMTNNAGLVIRMTDGSEFQITIVRSN